MCYPWSTSLLQVYFLSLTLEKQHQIRDKRKVLKFILGLLWHIRLFSSGFESLFKGSAAHRGDKSRLYCADGVNVSKWRGSRLNYFISIHTHTRLHLPNKISVLLYTLYLFFYRGVSGGQRLLVHDWHRWNFLCNPWRDKDIVFARFLCHLSLAAAVSFFPFRFSSQGQMIQRCCHMTQDNE